MMMEFSHEFQYEALLDVKAEFALTEEMLSERMLERVRSSYFPTRLLKNDTDDKAVTFCSTQIIQFEENIIFAAIHSSDIITAFDYISGNLFTS